jgi:hypothetical protein
VICIRPVAENPEQSYLLRRDGYEANERERCIILIDAQCRNAAYDPYDWPGSESGRRTHRVAHSYIQDNWRKLNDGDVVDVQFILGETAAPKVSERITAPI